ncbi:GATA zinc finger domain-containing protein 1 [Brevipalpus obovatus]|uniref:GATA zinc finger domain-containing protein 1 n=1 Tax=Brevipalpus obovatus TaxID=246614 RepID=UPI003D9EAEC5
MESSTIDAPELNSQSQDGIVDEDKTKTCGTSERDTSFEESLNPICTKCETKDSIFWIKDHERKLLCRNCSKILRTSKGALNSNKSIDGDKNVSRKSSDATAKESVENEAPGQSVITRRGSRRGKMRQNSCQNKLSAVKGKGRRSIFKKCVYKSPPSSFMPVTSDSIFYKGFLYSAGDIISLTDFDGSIYYAQIRGFLKDQYCEKSAAITWLIPTQQSPRNVFDAKTYILGPEEDIPRKLDCMTFVCHCPSDYFKLTNPPFITSTNSRPPRSGSFSWTRSGQSVIRSNELSGP